MKKWFQRIQPFVVKQLSLPTDLVFELPRITVIGHLHVYIENHQGLKNYTKNALTVKTKDGVIHITGKDFVIKMMLPEELLLEGVIEDITFSKKRG